MPLEFRGEPFVEAAGQLDCWYGNASRRTAVCKATELANDALYQATEPIENDRRGISTVTEQSLRRWRE